VGELGAWIGTGDADADASTINFVNQLGAPICFVIAVGGEWRGDVYALPEGFTREPAVFGDVICGAGGAERDPVTGLKLEVKNYAKILNTAIAEAISGHNDAEGLIARIKTGDATAFAQILNLVNVTVIGQDWIFANFAISGDWDGDLVFGVKPGEPDILGDLTRLFSTPCCSSTWYHGEPRLSITKEAEVTEASLPAIVNYTIVVANDGGDAHNVLVVDEMKGPDGEVIGKQQWDLETVPEGEEVTITYTIEFKEGTTPGYYTNSAVVNARTSTGGFLGEKTAQDIIEILPGGEVLSNDTCAPILTEYIRPWHANTPSQVRSLQSFLNAFEGENIGETGSYGSQTIAAVRRFQEKYADDVLAPWGISNATGNVYYTTQKKVNEIACGMELALTDEQLAEIEAFKAAPADEQDETIRQGRTGFIPTNLLRLPLFGGSGEFLKDAWNGLRPVSEIGQPASTSAYLKDEIQKTPLWAMFAPLVEALEIEG
jgi:hypothetical protein